MNLLYVLGVNLYTLAVRIAALWNPKARKWVQGRRGIWEIISEFNPGTHVYWFHCASLGEFEQGRPIMEAIKADQKCQIVVTFYSPSGYEIRKNYAGADLILYLPKDSKKNAIRFLDLIKPTHVFFIKYEFWAFYILECQSRKIPIYSVAALFRKDQVFFRSYGGFMRKVLKAFTHIFVQNEASQQLLEDIDITSKVCGDTRFDRVLMNAQNATAYPDIEQFARGHKVLVCGSIWPEDLEVIKQTIARSVETKVIIAPHEINNSFIGQIERAVGRKTLRYSVLNQNPSPDADIIIIDNIGMLMNLYQYGQLAFIGGGFKTGLHNILEPAAFGLPVIFGNKTDKFPEARTFIDAGIGFSVNNNAEFEKIFTQLMMKDLSEKVKAFMTDRRGATSLILDTITEGQS